MDAGCETPLDGESKNRLVTLAQMFAPIVSFHTRERFFPVDLPSTLAASQLYRFRDRVHEQEHDLVSAHPTLVDMAAASTSHFTTVDRWQVKPNVLAHPPFSMPVPYDPELDSVHQKYVDGTIAARLTTYVTVCRPREVPNYHGLLEGRRLRSGDVEAAILEGLLLNYYFFFPALTSPELRREGDWGGLSILLNHPDPQIARPVLYCYHKKLRDPKTGFEAYGPGSEGFLTPEQVVVAGGPTENVWRRSRVYVSLGRHNCYAAVPQSKKVHFKSGIPWPAATPQKVESGTYRDPAVGEPVTGETDWSWALGFLFPLLFGLACPAGGKKSKYTTYQEGDDELEGPPGSPLVADPATSEPDATSAYPTGDWGYQERHLDVMYVDTHDQQFTPLWDYPGYWGAAEQEEYLGAEQVDGAEPEPPRQVTWGRFGGARRPNLAAWSLWNLYWDSEFGAQ